MSAKVKAILTEIRDRLESTGYPVISGRMIDVVTDPMPCLGLKFSQSGVESDEEGRADTAYRISRQTLYLTLLGCVAITDITTALEELEDLETKIRKAVFTIQDPTLGKLARDRIMIDSRQSYVPDEHGNVGLVEINISVPYVETYGS